MVNLCSDAAHVKHKQTVEIGSSVANSSCPQEDHSELNERREYCVPVQFFFNWKCEIQEEHVCHLSHMLQGLLKTQFVFSKIYCYCSQKLWQTIAYGAAVFWEAYKWNSSNTTWKKMLDNTNVVLCWTGKFPGLCKVWTEWSTRKFWENYWSG